MTLTPVKAPEAVVGAINERAVLVDLTVRLWTAVKKDRELSREVAVKHGVTDETMGDYTKKLVAKAALKEVRDIAGAWTAVHRLRTTPWLDGDLRMLSSAGYFAYTTKMREYATKYDEAVERFKAAYPQYYAEAKAIWNGAFKDADYPKPSRIGEKFGHELRFYPVPVAGDFRFALTAEHQAQVAQQEREALDGAMADVKKRIVASCERMVLRLTTYKTADEDKASGRLYDSLVDSVKELVNVLPSLNLTGSELLDEVTEEMRAKLLRYDIGTLKESADARTVTARAAEDILKKMGGLI